MKRKAGLDDFRRRLRETRHALGMTQDEIAKNLEVSKPTYVRYEAGEMMPKLKFLSALKSKYNVNLNWLLHGEGSIFQDLGTPGEIPPQILGKLYEDEVYREMIDLMQIPEIERAIKVRLDELKRIFKEDIERYAADQKGK